MSALKRLLDWIILDFVISVIQYLWGGHPVVA